MLKKSRTQKGNYNKEFATEKQTKNSVLVEKSHYIRFFCVCMPFCYGQTSPLGVLLYTFGFSLSVLKLFFLSPLTTPRRFLFQFFDSLTSDY